MLIGGHHVQMPQILYYSALKFACVHKPVVWFKFLGRVLVYGQRWSYVRFSILNPRSKEDGIEQYRNIATDSFSSYVIYIAQ